MTMIAQRRLTWLASLGILLAGCASLRPAPPQIRQFRLEYSATAPTGPALPYVLRVPAMEVASTFDRDPIVYSEGEYDVGSYFYYRWSSNPGNMIADLLARDLANSGLYRDVQTAVSVTPPDFQLKGTVDEIEEAVAKPSGCSAHLSLRLTLAATRGPREQRVRFSKVYQGDDPCRCGDALSVVESMSRAMAQISAAVQADVYRNLAAEPLGD